MTLTTSSFQSRQDQGLQSPAQTAVACTYGHLLGWKARRVKERLKGIGVRCRFWKKGERKKEDDSVRKSTKRQEYAVPVQTNRRAGRLC